MHSDVEHHEGDFGKYMRDKIKKQRRQFAVDPGTLLSDIFKGVTIFVDGRTVPPVEELRPLIAVHGGAFETYETRSVTHIICSNLPDAKLKVAAKKKVLRKPILRPEWITDSIEAGRRLAIAPYSLLETSSPFFRRQLAETASPAQQKPSAGTPPRPRRGKRADCPAFAAEMESARQSAVQRAGLADRGALGQPTPGVVHVYVPCFFDHVLQRAVRASDDGPRAAEPCALVTADSGERKGIVLAVANAPSDSALQVGMHAVPTASLQTHTFTASMTTELASAFYDGILRMRPGDVEAVSCCEAFLRPPAQEGQDLVAWARTLKSSLCRDLSVAVKVGVGDTRAAAIRSSADASSSKEDPAFVSGAESFDVASIDMGRLHIPQEDAEPTNAHDSDLAWVPFVRPPESTEDLKGACRTLLQKLHRHSTGEDVRLTRVHLTYKLCLCTACAWFSFGRSDECPTLTRIAALDGSCKGAADDYANEGSLYDDIEPRTIRGLAVFLEHSPDESADIRIAEPPTLRSRAALDDGNEDQNQEHQLPPWSQIDSEAIHTFPEEIQKELMDYYDRNPQVNNAMGHDAPTMAAPEVQSERRPVQRPAFTRRAKPRTLQEQWKMSSMRREAMKGSMTLPGLAESVDPSVFDALPKELQYEVMQQISRGEYHSPVNTASARASAEKSSLGLNRSSGSRPKRKRQQRLEASGGYQSKSPRVHRQPEDAGAGSAEPESELGAQAPSSLFASVSTSHLRVRLRAWIVSFDRPSAVHVQVLLEYARGLLRDGMLDEVESFARLFHRESLELPCWDRMRSVFAARCNELLRDAGFGQLEWPAVGARESFVAAE